MAQEKVCLQYQLLYHPRPCTRKLLRRYCSQYSQLTEWQKLFGVVITTAEKLKEEPYLVLDTQYFSKAFKDRLLGRFDNLDE